MCTHETFRVLEVYLLKKWVQAKIGTTKEIKRPINFVRTLLSKYFLLNLPLDSQDSIYRKMTYLKLG